MSAHIERTLGAEEQFYARGFSLEKENISHRIKPLTRKSTFIPVSGSSEEISFFGNEPHPVTGDFSPFVQLEVEENSENIAYGIRISPRIVDSRSIKELKRLLQQFSPDHRESALSSLLALEINPKGINLAISPEKCLTIPFEENAGEDSEVANITEWNQKPELLTRLPETHNGKDKYEVIEILDSTFPFKTGFTTFSMPVGMRLFLPQASNLEVRDAVAEAVINRDVKTIDDLFGFYVSVGRHTRDNDMIQLF